MTSLCAGSPPNSSLQQPTLSSLLSKFTGADEQGVTFGLYQETKIRHFHHLLDQKLAD